MHVAVIGAGALGSAIALGLAEAGCDVTLTARGARLEWLRAHPVELEAGSTVKAVPVPVCTAQALTRPVDVAFLCIKAGDLEAAAGELAPHIAPGGAVVTLQNGVEAPLQAVHYLPGAAVLAGRVHGFFEMAGQRVRHVGVPPSVVLGGIDEASEAVVGAVGQLLRQAGFACEISANVMHDLWEKLMLAASLGGAAAVLGVPAGQVCRVAGGDALLSEALHEVARVGSACGAALGPADADRMLALIRQFPEDATTSLQRDLAAGRPSEYEAVVGAVLRSARKMQVPVPVFTRLDSELRARPNGLQ